MDRAGRRVDVVQVRAVERLGRAAVDVVGRMVDHARLREGPGESPGIVERVVHRDRGDPDDVGLAEVGDDPGPLEAIQPLVGVRQPEAELGAMARGSRGVMISTPPMASMRSAR